MPESTAAPDPTAVAEVTASIVAEVGEQMCELYSALPDLIWDHYPPFQELPPAEQSAWVDAVTAELTGDPDA